MRFKHIILGFTLAGGMFLAAHPAFADIVEQITLNTASANAGGGGQAEIIFSFLDGNGTGDNNNTVTLSDLFFGAGASLDGGVDTPNVTGTLGTSVSLSDSIFDSSIGILFDPASTVSFLLDLTNNPDAGGTPDSFSFVLFDTNGSLISTADPTGGDALMDINLDGTSTNFFSDAALVTITEQTAAVPEPSTLPLLAAWMAPLFALMSLRKRGRPAR